MSFSETFSQLVSGATEVLSADAKAKAAEQAARANADALAAQRAQKTGGLPTWALYGGGAVAALLVLWFLFKK